MGVLPTTTGTASPPIGAASFTGWAQATLSSLRTWEAERVAPETVRASLLQAGLELNTVLGQTGQSGFRLLGVMDRALLGSLSDSSVSEISLSELSMTLQRLTQGGSLEAFVMASAPTDLVPGQIPLPSRFIPGRGGSPTLSPGGTVVSDAIGLGLEQTRQAIGIQPPEKPFENEPGCFRHTRTVQAAIPRPNSREEKRRMMEAAQHDDTALDAYYQDQLTRMPQPARDSYMRTAAQIVKLHDRYEASNQEVLKAIEAAGGRPSPKILNEAKDRLERAIYDNKYLSSRGIDPLRFSILEARHEAELYAAGPSPDPEVVGFLKRQALALEANYVFDSLTGWATVARDVEKNRGEFHRLDLLSAHAKRVYGRLLAGYQILDTDEEDLTFFREQLFPFDQPEKQIQWHSPAIDSVSTAVAHYRETETAYQQEMKSFLKHIAPATWRHQELQTELTLEREELDYQFQVERFHAEFNRLSNFATAAGQPVVTDHQDYFAECMALLETKHRDNIKYWKGLASGEDVSARPHSRNSKNKAEMALMAYVINLFLEDLYKIHQHPTRPSWISFADNNVFTAFEEAISRGINPDDVRSWLADFMDKFGVLRDELGLTLNDTINKWFNLADRKATDRNYVHAKASTAGSGFRKGTGGKTIVYGLQDQAVLTLRQSPEPDLELSDPEHKVYPEGYFKRLQHYLLPILALANHTGIEEFRIFVYMATLGLPTPQLMQGGAADMPLAGPYGKAMAGILDRTKGADAVLELLYEMLLFTKESMFYFTGTRDGSGVGFSHYRTPTKIGKDGEISYANLHAARIVTDAYATGMEVRVASIWQQRSKGHGRPIVLQPIIHGGNLATPEKTWNLDASNQLEARVAQMLDNINQDGGLNITRDVARHIGFMLPILSRSLLSGEEVKEALAGHGVSFTYEDGSPLSEGDMDYLMQKVNNCAVLWLQEEDASAMMDLAVAPAQNEAQKHREAELRALPREEQMYESWHGTYRHMVDRLTDMSPPPSYDTRGRREAKTIRTPEQLRLDRVMPPDRAKALLKGFPKQGTDTARRVLQEMVQRGASKGEKNVAHGTTTAFDGDGFLWDHVFEIEEDIPDILYREVVDWMTGPPRSVEDEEQFLSKITQFTEHINLRPEAVAFLIGYRAQTGKAPVLYSSTMESRIYEMAKNATKTPLARAFFNALLGIDFYGWREQDIENAIRQAIAEKKIITRTQIAEYVTSILNRYRAAHFDPLARGPGGEPLFTDAERHDIELILRNKGDVHCKYRGLCPYDDLADDRAVNAWHAVSANRRGESSEKRSLGLNPFGIMPTQVRVYQPERFTANPLERYIAVRSMGPQPDSHAKARLNRGRDGSVLSTLRAMERDGVGEVESPPQWTLVARARRTDKVKGLNDDPMTIPIRRKDTRGLYLESSRKAKDLAVATFNDLRAMAKPELESMARTARELAELLEQDGALIAGASPYRKKSAVERLRPKKGSFRPLMKQSEHTMLERAILLLKAEHRPRAHELLSDLLTKRLYNDQVHAVRQKPDYPKMERSGALDQLKTTLMWIGNLAQHQAAGAIGKDLPQSKAIQALLLIGTYALSLTSKSSREKNLLLRLARSITDKDYPMEPRKMVEAYGVVAKVLGPQLLNWAVEKLASDERVPAEVRLTLRRHQELIRGHIASVGDHLQEAVQGGYDGFLGAAHVFGGLKNAGKDMQEILKLGVGPAMQSLLVGVVNSIIDDIRTQRTARGEVAPTSDMEVGQQLLDRLLQEAILLSGGEQSLVGGFLQVTRIRMDEHGFEASIRRLARIFDDFEWPGLGDFVQNLIHIFFPSERNAYDILAALKDNQAKAQELLVHHAELFAREEDTEEGKARFKRLAEALWRHADPKDHETIRDMVKRAHKEAFIPKKTQAAA